jgi:hypothetical protein
MLRRLILAFLVATAILGPLAAAASLPDPTWIRGMYDGADSDDLVALVWELAPGAMLVALAIPRPAACPSRLDPVAPAPAVILLPAFVSRAPPLA